MKLGKLGRILLHTPVGAAVPFLAWVCPISALLFGLGFLCYETVQEWRSPAKGWYDIAGFLWGIVLGELLVIILW